MLKAATGQNERADADSWYGVRDPRKRKQIQDRLAQRARRMYTCHLFVIQAEMDILLVRINRASTMGLFATNGSCLQ
jgi:hypothetical protein